MIERVETHSLPAVTSARPCMPAQAFSDYSFRIVPTSPSTDQRGATQTKEIHEFGRLGRVSDLDENRTAVIVPRIPQDITDEIPDNLATNFRSLRACLLVSKSWIQPCRPHHFHTVDFTSRNMGRWFKAFQCLGRVLLAASVIYTNDDHNQLFKLLPGPSSVL